MLFLPSLSLVASSIVNAPYLLHFICAIIFICMVNISMNNIVNLNSATLDEYSLVVYCYICICIHVWTHIIITKNRNCVYLWLLWSWFTSGANVLTRPVIPRHRKNSTWFCYSWCHIKFLNNCLLMLGFCCLASVSL